MTALGRAVLQCYYRDDNPTSTIHALALYIADSIKQRPATLFD